MAGSSPTEFEVRRADLVGEIGGTLEDVLQQLNTLNRNLEGIITIGNEFSAVEALWSQFEGVMGSEGGSNGNGEAGGDAGGKEAEPEADPESEAEAKLGNEAEGRGREREPEQKRVRNGAG